MRVFRLSLYSLFTIWAINAHASSFVHRNINALTDENEVIVQGQVLKTESYWSSNFIFTDVTIRPTQFLKGTLPPGDFKVTLIGGTVGETTVLTIDGAELKSGSEYLLFLKHEELFGVPNRLTIPDHIQGVFQVTSGRAVSEAAGHPLIPDSNLEEVAPGGETGFTINELENDILTHIKQGKKI